MEEQTEFSLDSLTCQRCAGDSWKSDGVSGKDGLEEEGAPSSRRIRRSC